MRTKLAYILLPLAMSACSVQETKPVSKIVTQPPVEQKKPDMFVERYYYQPPKETQVQIGRYSSADASNTDEQENLLNVVIQTEIPATVMTVGEAINFLLLRSGFSLAPVEAQGIHVTQLLQKSLPQAHRRVGPIMLKDALTMLVGKAFWMSVDPVHRLIAFDTVEEFK